MKQFIAFTKKEWMENIRNYKFMIIFVVCMFFGLTSPLLAKMMPTIMGELLDNSIKVTLPTPTALDAWSQFFKNLSQIGLVVLILLFSTSLTSEIRNGTLIHMLSKGLSRNVILFSKFSMMTLLWTIAYGSACILASVYTYFLFDNPFSYGLVIAIFCLWWFGILLLSFIIFASTWIRNNVGVMLFIGAFIGVLFIINILPAIQPYNPISLLSNSTGLLTKAFETSEVLWPIGISSILILMNLVLATKFFKKTAI